MFKSSSQSFRVIIIYRPPKSQKNNSTVNEFLAEFSILLESAVPLPGHLIIAGDFNIHLDELNSPDTVKFMNLLHSMGLHQHILTPTHNKGHILDLLITRSTDELVHSVDVSNFMNSDHSLIRFDLNLRRPTPKKVSISRCNFRTVSIDVFQDEISMKLSTYPLDFDAEVISTFYCNTVTEILDTLAPIEKKLVTEKVRAPWYCEELLMLRKNVRRLESKYRSTKLEIDRQIFLIKRIEYFRRCDELKADYHRARIQEADDKKLFKIVSELSDTKAINAKALPSEIPLKELPSRFLSYFNSKVAKLREGLISYSTDTGNTLPSHNLPTFSEVSVHQVRTFIERAAPKSWDLDIFPTNYIKKFASVLAPFITHLFNASLSSGVVPSYFKSAIIRPLLKNPDLDPNSLRNYRPVSNLPFSIEIT
ncbi:uncharacterized protein [Ptychodera flava]|uniref:uncharacterized protein n=1 Tax=Ptychodera flava TaxID=63121 RepID=UPI00396A9CEA